jgi:hypothetical protein
LFREFKVPKINAIAQKEPINDFNSSADTHAIIKPPNIKNDAPKRNTNFTPINFINRPTINDPERYSNNTVKKSHYSNSLNNHLKIIE